LNENNPIAQARLLEKVDWKLYGITNDEMALIRILTDLKGWGCIQIDEENRINTISITEFGKAFVEII